MMCADFASGGRLGQLMSHSCEELIVLPSGMMMFSFDVAGRMFVTFAFKVIK